MGVYGKKYWEGNCMVCGERKQVRDIDMYVMGSEGFRSCHECEMWLIDTINTKRFECSNARKAEWLRKKSELPESVDFRDQMPPVGDQGALGASSAFAGSALVEFMSDKPLDAQPSRILEYYNTLVVFERRPGCPYDPDSQR